MSVQLQQGALMEYANDQPQPDNSVNEGTSASTRPVVSFSGSGGPNLAVWKHKSESRHDIYSFQLGRSYKDGEGNYETTAYL